MKRTLLVAALSVMLVMLSPALALASMSAESLSPADVIHLDPALDGSVIVVEGEAVGDVLRAQGGGSWINVLGDEVGLGIWMTAEMVDRIEHLGHYKHSGDHIRVTGTLNRTCERHGGEFDVHAEEMQVLRSGEPLTYAFRPIEGVVGLAGCLIGLALWFRYRAIRAQL